MDTVSISVITTRILCDCTPSTLPPIEPYVSAGSRPWGTIAASIVYIWAFAFGFYLCIELAEFLSPGADARAIATFTSQPQPSSPANRLHRVAQSVDDSNDIDIINDDILHERNLNELEGRRISRSSLYSRRSSSSSSSSHSTSGHHRSRTSLLSRPATSFLTVTNVRTQFVTVTRSGGGNEDSERLVQDSDEQATGTLSGSEAGKYIDLLDHPKNELELNMKS